MEYQDTWGSDSERLIRSIKFNLEPLIVMVFNRLELAATLIQIFSNFNDPR